MNAKMEVWKSRFLSSLGIGYNWLILDKMFLLNLEEHQAWPQAGWTIIHLFASGIDRFIYFKNSPKQVDLTYAVKNNFTDWILSWKVS